MLFQIRPDNATSKYKLISQGNPGMFVVRTNCATHYHSACLHHSTCYHRPCNTCVLCFGSNLKWSGSELPASQVYFTGSVVFSRATATKKLVRNHFILLQSVSLFAELQAQTARTHVLGWFFVLKLNLTLESAFQAPPEMCRNHIQIV